MKYSSLLLLSLGLASAGAFAGNTSAGVGGALGGALAVNNDNPCFRVHFSQ